MPGGGPETNGEEIPPWSPFAVGRGDSFRHQPGEASIAAYFGAAVASPASLALASASVIDDFH